VFGAGPFTRGTIRQRPELAGEPLPNIPNPVELIGGHKPPKEQVGGPVVREQFYPGNEVPAPPLPVPIAAAGLTGGAIMADRSLLR
jgi:hypothetical protein